MTFPLPAAASLLVLLLAALPPLAAGAEDTLDTLYGPRLLGHGEPTVTAARSTVVYVGAEHPAPGTTFSCLAVRSDGRVAMGSDLCWREGGNDAKRDSLARIVVGFMLMGQDHCIASYDGTLPPQVPCCSRVPAASVLCPDPRQEPATLP